MFSIKRDRVGTVNVLCITYMRIAHKAYFFFAIKYVIKMKWQLCIRVSVE